MNKQLRSNHQGIRKLDRRNAIKHIDYDATSSPSNRTHSLDVSALLRSSFRVEGVDGDLDLICRSLGLDGPEDFAIPAAAWEARKSRSLSEPSTQGVKGQISDKLRVTGSNRDNLLDTIEAEIRVKNRVNENIVPYELGGNQNFEKFRVISSNRDNSVDTLETKGKVSENICVDHVRDCDELACELHNDQNFRKFRINGSNQDNLVETAEAEVRVRTNKENENRFVPDKVGVGIRDYDEVTCQSGDHHNLEKSGDIDSNRDNSLETFRPKVSFRERNKHGFSQVRKNGATPDKIEVRIRKIDESRDCVDELSTSKGSCRNGISVRSFRSGGSGIKGTRPPVLAPPPVMSSQQPNNTGSSWDLLRSFGPPSDDDSEPYAVSPLLEKKMTIRALSESCSDTSDDKDDDYINESVEPLHFVSPLGKFKCTINSWQKGDFLGSGSFGTVYEGFTDDGIFFAVKEVSLLDQGDQGKQSIYQLEQEIFFLSHFEHENIVQYYGTDKDKGKLYIFLELVTKGSLASLYQKYNLQDSQVSAYTRQILYGLNYLHLRKVVHRDIKCANILVDAGGSVKLADFGLAKATNLNDVKSCKGTAFWMAPEVVNRKNNGYGLAADIWSLGCTVLEMLTRRIPYSHLEGMQALFRIGKGEPPPIPNSLSSEACDFISKCLQVNPDDRPTAAQLLEHPFVQRPLATSSTPASPFHHGKRS